MERVAVQWEQHPELLVLHGLPGQQLGLATWEEAAVDGTEAETLLVHRGLARPYLSEEFSERAERIHM